MKIKSHKVIIIVNTIVFIHLLSIFILCYLPFVQMNQIDTWEQIGSCKDDKILNCITLLKIYPHCWFIHKGDSYNDIPFSSVNEDMKKREFDIKFNWDNSVTISSESIKYDLHINKIEIETKVCPRSDRDYVFKHHENRDSLLVRIAMYDEKNNNIYIYRQKSTMPYGGKRVGFLINLDENFYITGGEEWFHY